MESNHELSPEKAYAKYEVESFRTRAIAELEGMKLELDKKFKSTSSIDEAIERLRNLK